MPPSVPSRLSRAVLWVLVGMTGMTVLTLLLLPVADLARTQAYRRPGLTASVRQLCFELKRECVGKGKPADPLLRPLCQAGASLCRYRYP